MRLLSRLPSVPVRHAAPRWLLAAGLACVPLAAATAAPVATGAPAATTLAARIDHLIGQPRFASASWGIAVVSLDSGRTLYAHDADRLLQPASTAKLFTAALSLSTLGMNYRIPTRLLGRDAIHDGRLNGPLVLYGMGDPTLGTASSSDWADQLASQLAARGVHRVHGDLIADDSYFTGPPFGAGWEAGDLQSGFAVPSSALSVQENDVELSASPGAAVGLPASLTFTPVDATPPVLGQLTTRRPGTPDDINLYRAPGDTTLYVFGSMAAKAPQQRFKLAVPDPALLAGRQLRRALLRHGIRIDGTLKVIHWPQDDAAVLARTGTLAEIQSPTLMDILRRGLKRSQNLYLQNLLLSVGAHEQALEPAAATNGFTSSEGWGIKALQQLLRRIGISPAASLIVEGSGLSRRDLVTPRAMVQLLGYLAAQPYADELRDALPIAGVDGTLLHRMRGTAAENNLHAKTGSMSGVHGLAGYVTSAGGERLAFAIILDNYQPMTGDPGASSDIDALAVLLANFRGRTEASDQLTRPAR
jgi:serine-type D-Ala-D-Ala carboxypeptidase/endopeptidase (penicillin-binding protein 4)